MVDLAQRCSNLDAGDLVLVPPDGHRGVRCLVRVDPDQRIHTCLLGSVEPRGHAFYGLFVLDPLLSHTVAKPERETFR